VRVPTEPELDLLLAALGSTEDALPAWQRWRTDHRLEDCEYLSHCLLSLIYRRLPQDWVSPADRSILRGLYRYQWTRNQLVSRSATLLLGHFYDEGIEAIVLNGLTLAHLAYQDLGIRPLQNLALLVRPSCLGKALKVLESAGWSATQTVDVAKNHCWFSSLTHPYLQLHWYASEESRWAESDQDFWQSSRSFRLDSLEARALSPAHQLLQLLIQEGSPLVWVTDACILLDSEDGLDWTGFLESTRGRRSTLIVASRLRWLHQEMKRVVPESVFWALAAIPVSWNDRLYYQSKVLGRNDGPVLLRLYLHYLRTERPAWGGNLPGFFHFLLRRWQLRSVWHLPGRAWRALSRRFEGNCN